MTKINKLHDKFERGVLKVVGKSPIIGRSLAKVLKPALDAAKSGREGVDKFSKTKAGKIILTAVAIYFGGAALSGAMGGGAAAATGATGWAGAAQGLSGAWTGIMQAGSAVAAGEFGAAGSALSTGMAGGSAGFTAAEAGTMAVPELGMIGQVGADGAALGTGAATAGGEALASTVANAATTTVTPITQVAGVPPSAYNAPFQTAAQSGLGPVSSTTLPQVAGSTLPQVGAGEGGMLTKFLANKYVAPALIQAGTGMLSSLAAGKAQQAMYDRQQDEKDAELERYNRNIGTRIRRGG